MRIKPLITLYSFSRSDKGWHGVSQRKVAESHSVPVSVETCTRERETHGVGAVNSVGKGESKEAAASREEEGSRRIVPRLREEEEPQEFLETFVTCPEGKKYFIILIAELRHAHGGAIHVSF